MCFEVVSIRPGPSGNPLQLFQSGRVYWRTDDAQADLGGATVMDLIRNAYHIPSERISGPGWLTEARFDIHAKLPLGATRSMVPEMLQCMLAERFKLALHPSERETAVYELRPSGSSLKIKESASDDSKQIPCSGGPPPQHHVCHKVSMDDLAHMFSATASYLAGASAFGADRPIVNATGLTGTYDFELDYGRTGGRDGGETGEVVSIFDGLRQIGLELVAAKRPFDYLVIDHIERTPSEN
jgi:uncharacterized protein (TIGR03435 family)